MLFVFPAILVLGRHSSGGARTLWLCKAAGRISYPLYITHYPFVYVYMNWVSSKPKSGPVTAVVATTLYVALILVSIAAITFWDTPIRRKLGKAPVVSDPIRISR